jgi:hypothetical protein
MERLLFLLGWPVGFEFWNSDSYRPATGPSWLPGLAVGSGFLLSIAKGGSRPAFVLRIHKELRQLQGFLHTGDLTTGGGR